MTQERTYAVRYRVDEWNKPHDESARKTDVPGVMSTEEYGYADDVILVSVARTPTGGVKSFLLMGTEGGVPFDPMAPPRPLLRELQDYLTHLIENHCPEG